MRTASSPSGREAGRSSSARPTVRDGFPRCGDNYRSDRPQPVTRRKDSGGSSRSAPQSPTGCCRSPKERGGLDQHPDSVVRHLRVQACGAPSDVMRPTLRRAPPRSSRRTLNRNVAYRVGPADAIGLRSRDRTACPTRTLWRSSWRLGGKRVAYSPTSWVRSRPTRRRGRRRS